LCGCLSDKWTLQILRTGALRLEVRRGLLEKLRGNLNAEAWQVLHALDARAAYEPLQALLSQPAGKWGRGQGWLMNEYHTLFAQRFVLKNARALHNGADGEFSCILRSFGFTHEPVS